MKEYRSVCCDALVQLANFPWKEFQEDEDNYKYCFTCLNCGDYCDIEVVDIKE